MAENSAIMDRMLKVSDNYTSLLENNSDGNPIYIGDAEPGTLITDFNWRIKKITYDTDGNPTAIQWAGGSRAFKFRWDNRVSYTYS
jgi:hypothetical protein